MAEIYSFTAKVVGRLTRRIHISPENPDAFMDYLEREGISAHPYRVKGMCRISVGNRKLIEAAIRADRVQYAVTKIGNRMVGVKSGAGLMIYRRHASDEQCHDPVSDGETWELE